MSYTDIQLRGNTEAFYTALNPVPLDREPVCVFATDGTYRLKFGDGTTPFNDLPYVSGDPETIEEPCPTPTTDVTVTHNKDRDPVDVVFLETGTGFYFDVSYRVVTPGVSVAVHLDIPLVGKILLKF